MQCYIKGGCSPWFLHHWAVRRSWTLNLYKDTGTVQSIHVQGSHAPHLCNHNLLQVHCVVSCLCSKMLNCCNPQRSHTPCSTTPYPHWSPSMIYTLEHIYRDYECQPDWRSALFKPYTHCESLYTVHFGFLVSGGKFLRGASSPPPPPTRKFGNLEEMAWHNSCNNFQFNCQSVIAWQKHTHKNLVAYRDHFWPSFSGFIITLSHWNLDIKTKYFVIVLDIPLKLGQKW